MKNFIFCKYILVFHLFTCSLLVALAAKGQDNIVVSSENGLITELGSTENSESTDLQLEYFANIAYNPNDGCYYAVKDEQQYYNATSYLLAEQVAVVGKKMVTDKDVPGLSWKLTNKHLVSANGNWLITGPDVTDRPTNSNILTMFMEQDEADPSIRWVRESSSIDKVLTFGVKEKMFCFKLWKTNKNYYKPTYVYDIAEGYLRDQIGKGNYGTICLPYNVEGKQWAGATFYEIVGKRTEGGIVKSVRFKEVNALKAGHPYVFLANADTLATIYGTVVAEVPEEANGLVGSFEGCDVDRGMYIIYNNTIKRCGIGCSIGKNRAYINMDLVPEIQDPVESNYMEIPMYISPTGVDGQIADFTIQSNNHHLTTGNIVYDCWGRATKKQKGQVIVTRQNGKSSRVLFIE